MFALAVSFHGFLHGVVVGCLNDVKDIILTMIVVIVYKIPIGLAVGVAFMNTGRKCIDIVTITFAIPFVLSTPTGILMMMVLDDD